jgi:hypothetical protein
MSCVFETENFLHFYACYKFCKEASISLAKKTYRSNLRDFVDVRLVVPLGKDVAGALLVAQLVDFLQQRRHVDAAEAQQPVVFVVVGLLLLLDGTHHHPVPLVGPHVRFIERRQVELGRAAAAQHQ